MSADETLLEVRDLAVEYDTGPHQALSRAVDGVSFTIRPGETLGLVGESGSGKSTIAKAVLHLVPAAHGSIAFDGRDITRVTPQQRTALSSQIQVVFQDPYSSFNPSRTIESSLCEMTLPHGHQDRAEVRRRAAALLERVGMPASAMGKYPGEFSGGQRQRIAIARALMVNPRLLVCDEAVSALDLSVQAQVVNLLRSIQRVTNLAMLFISHDLTVVEHVSQRMLVLYHGRVMETGGAKQVHTAPGHPYTRLLMDAVPTPDPTRRSRHPLQVVSQAHERSARECVFAPRCAHATDVCEEVTPPVVVLDEGHTATCHHARPAAGPVLAPAPEDLIEAPEPSGLPPWAELMRRPMPGMPPLDPGETTDGLRRSYPELSDVMIDEVEINSHVRARFYHRSGSAGRPMLVWAHGGAFVAGDLDMPEANWVGLALAGRNLNVLSVDYRKALDGTAYPAPMEDVLAAWRWATEHADSLGAGPLHLGGASAGGALAAAAALKLRDDSGTLPASVALVYPSLHRELPPWRRDEVTRIRDAAGITYFSSSWIRDMAANYLGDGGPDHGRYAFPGEAELHDLPPHLLLLAEHDTLRSSGQAHADSLRSEGVGFRCHVEPGTVHGFLNTPHAPGGVSGIEVIAQWINEGYGQGESA
ncbi:oligopeptide/dipeptide ABC transporter ATP-binding protein [Streptomyces europaeiscabiei]|uniref:oligopeptide/dipeptide ABC transporter ATP-binding protein n=1 Tax=Streptomyces europaeiscabiei TaxID=146819 RepID=UPI002E261CB1|nr:alpha/beta hydrolase fold domain-containing protein [Streptomyces europaeiscabiei]